MYNNSGAKIKGIASTMAAIGMIGSAVIGMVLMFEEPVLGILVVIAGCIGAWLSSLLLAGFGELVENSYKILKLLEEDKGSSGSGEAVAQGTSLGDVTVSSKEIREYMEREGVPYGAAVVALKKQKLVAQQEVSKSV